MKSVNSALTAGMIALFCERRIASVLPADATLALQGYLTDLLVRNEFPPYRGTHIDLEVVAAALVVDVALLRQVRAHLRPIFDAVARAVAEEELRPRTSNARTKGAQAQGSKTSVGRPAKVVVEFPEPLETEWDDPDDFGGALRLHAARHGETIHHLAKAIIRPEDGINRSTLISWARGVKAPRSVVSLQILRRIERRYRLPEGYFAEKAANPGRAAMVSPQVWDWYLQWREQRRGFYTKWEIDLLSIAAALNREETGWLRQTPRIGEHLEEIEGLITRRDIDEARADWAAACDRMYRHARRRIKEIDRVARIHRDPFEPILPVLEAASPVGEFRKITEEILRRMPDERRHPRAAAEAVRAFLLLRIGLHTGLRQKNLRELLLCARGGLPTSERRLEDMKRGELRWSSRDQGWEILIPSVAFKNASSSFFGSKPFRLILPDLGGLYEKLEAYIDRHRARLIGSAADPGTFFVKTTKMTSTNAAYDQNTFYEAWRLVIQRYGVFNPWTGRGAINGLLPHGPHNVRDVLATHILKQTGSYEQASYAIQDTPEMVAQHYGRFLPQDKAEIAARILNKVWEAA